MPAALAPGGGGAAKAPSIKVQRAFAGAHGAPLPSVVVPVRSAADIKALAPAHTAAPSRYGSIPYAATIAPRPMNVVGRLLSQVYHLPSSTVEGVAQLGSAAAHDIAHPANALRDLIDPYGVGYGKALLGGGNTALQGTVTRAVHADPIYQAVTKGSLKPLSDNPLGTALDATGIYGVVGKGLGAVARAGALGEDARSAAALGGRAPRIVAPGIEGTDISRAYSPNLITKALQVTHDKAGLRPVSTPHALRLQVAAAHTGESGVHSADRATILKALKSAKPKGKEEAAVAPLVAMTGQNRLGLERLLNNTLREPTDHLHPETAASRGRMVSDLQAMIAKDNQGKFDWTATNHAADVYHQLISAQEAQKADLGLRESEQMARRLDNARALLEPDVHYLKNPVADPTLKRNLQVAKGDQKQAAAALDLAKQRRAAYGGVPGTRGAYQGASGTLADLTRAIPVHPATDTLMSHALDLRDMLDTQHPQIKALHDAEVKLRQAELARTKEAAVQARKDVKANPLRGTVIEDPTRPQVLQKPIKGLRVRPLTANDAADLRSRDPARQSYVSAVNPERKAAQSTRAALALKGGHELLTLAERGVQPYTGEALTAGDLRTGWSAMPNTLLRNAGALSDARETQSFLQRFGLKNLNDAGVHEPWATETDAAKAAQEYQRETGIKMAQLRDGEGNLHVLPEASVKELNRQRSLDRPTAAGKLLTTPNRVFRKTVLPYSVKLPVMHQVENASRTIAMEKGNLPRIIRDSKAGRAMLAASSDPERLRALTTPGSLSRTGAGGEAEDLGKLVTEPPGIPAQAVHGVARVMGGLADQIIHGQRILERGAQTVALGAHGRRLLQEMGHSWTDANLHVTDYAQKLADHLATPADAERAARAMHDAMGKYNAFTANTRLALRVMPFASWYMNAAKLVYVTLPRDHPLFDALVQDTQHANAQQWNAQHQGLPGDMQDTLKVGPNAYLDIAKLTPIGLPGQAPETTASQLVLPEFSSAAAAAMGKDPFWQDLYGPNTAYGKGAAPGGLQSPTGSEKGQAGLSAIEQLVQSMAGPVNDVARVIYGHGGTLYNTSTPDLHLLTAGKLGRVDIKKGSTSQQRGILNLPAGLDKVLDPLHPTTIKPKTHRASAGLGGSGSGLGGSLGSSSLGGSL